MPGTLGWGTKYGYVSTAPWTLPYPSILKSGPSFGLPTNQFSFSISWATNLDVVVEATTNLANSVWQALQTNSLVGGTSIFADPQWTNYAGRFYRIRSP
jgi:hypothetical protein